MDAERRRTVEGLAAIAVTAAEMGEPDDVVRGAIVGTMQRIGVDDPALLVEAADAIQRMPQPLEETTEETERREPVRQLLGVTSAADQLAAALRARALLQVLARELGENGA